jgi:hypothetical protein
MSWKRFFSPPLKISPIELPTITAITFTIVPKPIILILFFITHYNALPLLWQAKKNAMQIGGRPLNLYK